MTEKTLPTFADIEDARKRIAGEAVVTPLLEDGVEGPVRKPSRASLRSTRYPATDAKR